MNFTAKRNIIIIIGLILLLLFGTLAFSLYTIRSLKSNLSVQVDTRTIIIKLKDNLTELLNAETGERGFVITGDTMYLQPYNNSIKTVKGTIAELRQLNEHDPEQRSKLDSLDAIVQKKLLYIETLLKLKNSGRESEVMQLLKDGSGKAYMDTIRAINQRMQALEERIFAERKIATSASIERARLVFIVEAVFSSLVTLLLAVVIINELNRRSKAEVGLKQTNHELKMRNKEIEQFAYVASHDLQEPLRTISNFASLLSPKLQDHPDPAAKQYLQTIVNGTKRMSTLIFDLLEYARIGKDMTKLTIDCNKIVSEVLSDMQAVIRDTNATVKVETLPVVNGYVYLKSMFQNLLSNALKFHRPGESPVVGISAHLDGNEYVFKVADNGIGISKEYFDRIFIMFQRLHTRAEYPGTGIGLAQCKKIAELHKGRMWIESEYGKGTSFYFTIPK